MSTRSEGLESEGGEHLSSPLDVDDGEGPLVTPGGESELAAAAATEAHLAAETLRAQPRYGWLNKRGAVNTSQKRRYFTLVDSVLSWFSEVPSRHSTSHKGSVSLIGATVEADQRSAALFSFTIALSSDALVGRPTRERALSRFDPRNPGTQTSSSSSRLLLLEAESEAERLGWLEAIHAHSTRRTDNAETWTAGIDEPPANSRSRRHTTAT
jgi:hypothetical protein